MDRLLLLLLLKKKYKVTKKRKMLENDCNRKKFRVKFFFYLCLDTECDFLYFKVHPILKQRPVFGINSLMVELRLDSNRFLNYFRMSVTLFDMLLHMVGPRIIKTEQFRDDVIEPSQRLALTLR